MTHKPDFQKQNLFSFEETSNVFEKYSENGKNYKVLNSYTKDVNIKNGVETINYAKYQTNTDIEGEKRIFESYTIKDGITTDKTIQTYAYDENDSLYQEKGEQWFDDNKDGKFDRYVEYIGVINKEENKRDLIKKEWLDKDGDGKFEELITD